MMYEAFKTDTFLAFSQGWVIRRIRIIRHMVLNAHFTVLDRDGSYGLLRHPIRYNTLFIRNTRIIRRLIYAILGVPVGLHQPPSNHHELSPQPPEHYNTSW